ncbi:hypothetical protein [Actinomadura sp. 3N407]|uniref:hypothetical protein n=1 Tax=Actinomadura sp. 3N407 TaxID=3457423 RepID=UPI003FCE31B8
MVFRRSKPAAAAGPDPDENAADIPHQNAFIEWSNDFYELDEAALALLTPEQRQLQVTARAALWRYADALWAAAKTADLEPANKAGVYNAIAALRDMGASLHGSAQDAQSNAGEDDESEFPSMEFPPLTEWFDVPELQKP